MVIHRKRHSCCQLVHCPVWLNGILEISFRLLKLQVRLVLKKKASAVLSVPAGGEKKCLSWIEKYGKKTQYPFSARPLLKETFTHTGWDTDDLSSMALMVVSLNAANQYIFSFNIRCVAWLIFQQSGKAAVKAFLYGVLWRVLVSCKRCFQDLHKTIISQRIWPSGAFILHSFPVLYRTANVFVWKLFPCITHTQLNHCSLVSPYSHYWFKFLHSEPSWTAEKTDNYQQRPFCFWVK